VRHFLGSNWSKDLDSYATMGLPAQIEILELRRGPETLARLEVVGHDYPWILANIFPTAAFEAVRRLFREQPDDQSGAKVRGLLKEQQIVMRVPGHNVLEFILVVEGARARFKFDKIE
jgi:hypothetical protein